MPDFKMPERGTITGPVGWRINLNGELRDIPCEIQVGDVFYPIPPADDRDRAQP